MSELLDYIGQQAVRHAAEVKTLQVARDEMLAGYFPLSEAVKLDPESATPSITVSDCVLQVLARLRRELDDMRRLHAEALNK